MEKNNIPEEVTITPVIRDIERLVIRLVWSVGAVVKWLLNGIEKLVKFVLKHFIVAVIAAVVGGALGYASFSLIPQAYESNLVVSLNVDATVQFHADIHYFNSLIEKKEVDKLREVFHITEAEAESLQSITVEPYSTYVKRVEKLNNLYTNQDTSAVYMLDLEKMVESTDPALFSEFTILVKSSDPTVFAKLEEPMLTFLEDDVSLNTKLSTKKQVIELKIKSYEKEMSSLDSLKAIYNVVLLEHARSKDTDNTGTVINMGQQQSLSWMNPLKIYHLYETYADKLIVLEGELQNLSSCYAVEAHFSDYGRKSGLGRLLRMLVGAVVIVSLSLLTMLGVQHRKTLAS